MNQRRASKAPFGLLHPKFCYEVLLPNDLAARRFKTKKVAMLAQRVNFVAIHRRRGPWPAFVVFGINRTWVRVLPEFLAGGSIQAIDRIGLILVAQREQASLCDADRGEADPHRCFP